MSCCRRVEVINNKAGVNLAFQAAFGRNFTDNQASINLGSRLNNAVWQVFENGREKKMLNWQTRPPRRKKQPKNGDAATLSRNAAP